MLVVFHKERGLLTDKLNQCDDPDLSACGAPEDPSYVNLLFNSDTFNTHNFVQ